jgi:hypothetical protein
MTQMAEGVGFEPTRPSSGLPAFEASALNRTMRPLPGSKSLALESGARGLP